MNTKLTTYKTNMTNEKMTLVFSIAVYFFIIVTDYQYDVDWMNLGVRTTYLVKLIFHIPLLVLCCRFNYRSLQSLDSIEYIDEEKKCYGLVDYEKNEEDFVPNEDYKKLHWLSVINIVITFNEITECFVGSFCYVILYFTNFRL